MDADPGDQSDRVTNLTEGATGEPEYFPRHLTKLISRRARSPAHGAAVLTNKDKVGIGEEPIEDVAPDDSHRYRLTTTALP